MPHQFRTRDGKLYKASQPVSLTLADGTKAEGIWGGSAQVEKLKWWLGKPGHELAQTEEVAEVAVRDDDVKEIRWGAAPEGARVFFVLTEPIVGKNGQSYRLAKMVTTASTPAQHTYFNDERFALFGKLNSDGTFTTIASLPPPALPAAPQGDLFSQSFMLSELDVVEDVSQRLDLAGIDYMLTGSMAMNYYAQPRMTRDIDLVVALIATDATRIRSIFTPDYNVSLEAVSDAIARQFMFNIIHEDSIIKVDFIVRKQSPYRLAEFERRQRITFNEFSTWIVSKEDLVISKLEWAKESRSTQQMSDIRNLLSTGCDVEYISHWTGTLGLSDFWNELRHE
jgi:hypothetical protein